MFPAFPQRSQNTMAEIKPGIYRIVVAGSVNSARLTRRGPDMVTILPAGAAPELEQEVMYHFLMRFILSCLFARSVGSCRWQRRPHHHRSTLSHQARLLPELEWQS